MPERTVGRRSRARRAGESVFGLLLVLKNVFMALLALLLVVAGGWTSWDAARPAMFEGAAERGSLTVERCADDVCRGVFAPAGGGASRERVSVSASVVEGTGDRVPVALLPEGDEAVRTGAAGVMYAWVPLAGGLLLAALVLAGGLQMRRTAWTAGLLGAAVMAGAFALL